MVYLSSCAERGHLEAVQCGFENGSGRSVIPWTSADARTKNANVPGVVARVEICSEPLRPENESCELAVATLSTHSGG